MHGAIIIQLYQLNGKHSIIRWRIQLNYLHVPINFMSFSWGQLTLRKIKISSLTQITNLLFSDRIWQFCAKDSVSSKDFDLEAFSRYLADGSFSALSFRITL